MSYNTIKVKKYLDIVEEFKANAAITPGMLIEQIAGGNVRAHATAEGNVLPMFALEDELQGNDIDTAYAANDRVQAWIPNRGEIVNAILKDGENVAIGDFVESAGSGYLQKHVADTASSAEQTTIVDAAIVGVAIEALDLSDSSGAESSGALGYNKRLLVRII